MKKSNALCFFLLSLILSSCGRSVFEPMASSDSTEAIKEDAIIALDNDDYKTAISKLKPLWQGDKSNEITQLYAIAVLGKGNFSVFNIVKNALKLNTGSSKSGGTDIMNQMASNSTAIFGGEITPARQAHAKQALDILLAAKNQSGTALTFQKCLTAGIYAVPVLQVLTKAKAKLDEIQALQANANYCDASNIANVQTMGIELTAVIADASAASASISDIGSILDKCLPPSSAQNINQITSTINLILTTADKGCTVVDSQVQTVGTVALPLCLNSYISATTAGAVAGDKKIAGCELFLHCAGGGCLKN